MEVRAYEGEAKREGDGEKEKEETRERIQAIRIPQEVNKNKSITKAKDKTVYRFLYYRLYFIHIEY